MSSAGTTPQPSEITGEAEPAGSHGVAESGYVETPFGAPVVRELPPDPGPHEFLLTAKMVAGRLGLCTAVVYRLCERGALPVLRIGGALRFEPDAIRRYIERTRV